MGKKTDDTMGGLDALVAAASSVAGQGKNRRNRTIPMDLIDPALQNNESPDIAEAMSAFLSNPSVVQLIAEYNAKKQHRQVSLYTQLLSGSNIPNTTPDTPIQQTRSGRISRPPIYPPPPNNPFQQFLNNQNQANIPINTNNQIINNNINNNDQNQIQAIKDALENVSSSVLTGHQQQNNDISSVNNSISDQASYDALLQAVNNDSSVNVGSRFWGKHDLLNGLPNWNGGIEATTLAQVTSDSPTSFSQRILGHGLPTGKSIIEEHDHRKRSNSVLDDTGDDESLDSPGGKRYKGDTSLESENTEGLPQWPLPPTGKGGRKNMPREELLARRRARNRVAAQESRKKKKEFFGNIADQLKDRDGAYEQLQAHCRKLEREVEALRQVVIGAGLQLPNDLPTSISTVPQALEPPTALPSIEDTSFSTESFTSNMDTSFHDLFTIDDNDADDLDFIPPSSPKRDDDGSDSEESEDEDEPTPIPAPISNKPGGKKSKRKSEEEETPKTNIDTPNNDDTPMGDVTEEAEDVEEDLFLPIEDVDIPSIYIVEENEEKLKLVKQAMNELHVDTPKQLINVIKKMAETAGYGGVTEEQVGMLSKLLALGQAQGMSVW